MRILFWSETFYPRIGGVEVMGMELVRALRARGHELAIVAGPYQDDDGIPQFFEGIPIYRFPFEYEQRAYTVEMVTRIKLRLAKLRAEFRPEIIHLYHSSRSFFFHSVSLKSPSEPAILSLHSSYFNAEAELVHARRQLCRRVQWTTACSRAILDDTLAMVPEIVANSSVIYNSLPLPNCEPTALNFAEPRILYVGRLHPNKGIEIAIAAFARLHDSFPRARLLIAGRGREEAFLRSYVAEMDLQTVVDFLGLVAPADVPQLINQATMMLVPSRSEPFGLVALQGGQMARPVIASRVGGLPEVIVDGETGLLVEPENPDELADAIKRLLTDQESARSMGVAARRHVQDCFAWTTFVDQFEALYARLIEQSKVHT